MSNVMAALPNIGGAFCESSVIPFLVPHRKVWLTPAAGVPCSNAAKITRTRDLDVIKWILDRVKFCQGAIRASENVYNVAAQETAKHRAKSGWPPVSDVAAVTNARRRETVAFAGVPQTRQQISAASRPSSPYCEDMWGRYCCLIRFPYCRYVR